MLRLLRIDGRWVSIIAVVLIAACYQPAAGQGTIFTYQGQLKDGGAPVNGPYDITFRLFDTDVAGAQVGLDVALAAVTVTNGLFTAPLDFGAGIFDGSPRWLEIEVNAVILSPRQSLTAAPYSQMATRAQSSGIADYANGPWVPNGLDLFYNVGNIGIGINTPTARLEIGGTPGLDGIKFPDGTMQVTAPTGGPGFWSSSGPDIFNNNGGNVGIGTNTPLAKLDLRGTMIMDTGADAAIFTGTGAVELNRYVTLLNSLGWTSASGLKAGGILCSDSFFYANPGKNDLIVKGNVGIGTAAPLAKLHLVDSDSVSHRIESFGGTNAWSRVELKNFDGQWDIGTSRNFNGNQLYFYRQGSPAIAFGIQPNGDAFLQGAFTCKVLTITGADLAEKFPTSEQPKTIEPGTVMEIDPAHAGKLRMARGAYNRRVAGVISGAGDMPIGAILGNLPGKEDAPPIALSGRVYVRCDASYGAIEPGDLLTTSDTPGHAMKAADHSRAPGAVIGKAMSRLESGTGLVLVLVSLQ